MDVKLLLLLYAVIILLPCCTPESVDGEIRITEVNVTSSEMEFFGNTTLPANTCIETLLYQDNEAVSWWPARCVDIQDSQWTLRVYLDTPFRSINTSSIYTLKAWYRKEPAILAPPFTFDVQGPPQKSPNPTEAVFTLLPESAHPLLWKSQDLNNDQAEELIVVAGFGGVQDQQDFDFLDIVLATPDSTQDAIDGYRMGWRSGPLVGVKVDYLRIEDLNNNGQPEIVVKQYLETIGYSLQVFSQINEGLSYQLLRPEGGYFDAQQGFGNTDAYYDDIDNDGIYEIFALYELESSLVDLYTWDGYGYTYIETREMVE